MGCFSRSRSSSLPRKRLIATTTPRKSSTSWRVAPVAKRPSASAWSAAVASITVLRLAQSVNGSSTPRASA